MKTTSTKTYPPRFMPVKWITSVIFLTLTAKRRCKRYHPRPGLTTEHLLPGEHTRLACRGRRPRRPHLCISTTSCRIIGSSPRGGRLQHARQNNIKEARV